MGPDWESREDLLDHFERHGAVLGCRTVDEYVRSSKATLDGGTAFTYRDRWTDELHLGYYDRLSGRFTAVSEDGGSIVTHFRCREGYVKNLPEHDYR